MSACVNSLASHLYRYGLWKATTHVLDTLASGAGVVRDFSHVGITMYRNPGDPARMGVGDLDRLDPMALPAWFETYLGGCCCTP